MADGFNTQQVAFLVGVVALVVGIVFHVIYLVKDRSTETSTDTYNRENAKMFFLMAAGLFLLAIILGKRSESM